MNTHYSILKKAAEQGRPVTVYAAGTPFVGHVITHSGGYVELAIGDGFGVVIRQEDIRATAFDGEF